YRRVCRGSQLPSPVPVTGLARIERHGFRYRQDRKRPQGMVPEWCRRRARGTIGRAAKNDVQATSYGSRPAGHGAITLILRSRLPARTKAEIAYCERQGKNEHPEPEECRRNKRR